MSTPTPHHPSSYRDPSGFIFEKDGRIYRQVNRVFQEDFDHFIDSGCYQHLVKQGLLIPHEPVAPFFQDDEHYATLLPERIAFISYPYEWSFSMLKDAALLTLQLMREALHYKMILKDATPFNIQWHKGRMIFIDTLSFERYQEKTWIAYRQFCETFLAPLLLMHHRRQPLQSLQLAWPEGIPLATASVMLPWKTKLSLHTYLHIHLHASVAAKQKPASSSTGKPFSQQKLLNLVNSLETLVTGLKMPAVQSTWSHYYDEVAGRDNYLEEKKKIIGNWVEKLQDVRTGADLGANEGAFSALLAQRGIATIAADFDPYCIDRLYTQIRNGSEKNIQPLIIDLSNPSPAIGVNNEERASFLSRLKVDLLMGLALVHHLAIGKNIGWNMIAKLFANKSRYLVIEFVPKSDEKVQLMLSQKKDIYTAYTEEKFLSAFSQYYLIKDRQLVGQSGRTLFLFEHR